MGSFTHSEEQRVTPATKEKIEVATKQVKPVKLSPIQRLSKWFTGLFN